MAERRTITQREKTLEALRVTSNKIKVLDARQDALIAQAKDVGEQIKPLSARMDYLLQDPELTDQDRAMYEERPAVEGG